MARADQLRPLRRTQARAQTNPILANPELRLAASAAKFCTLCAVPVLGVAWVAAGSAGVVGAGIAALLVTALLFAQAGVLAVCARRGGATLMIGAYLGFFSRLIATASVLGLLQRVEGIHRPSLVIGAIVLVIATLLCESWHISANPAFFWIDPRPAPARGRTNPERTRV